MLEESKRKKNFSSVFLIVAIVTSQAAAGPPMAWQLGFAGLCCYPTLKQLKNELVIKKAGHRVRHCLVFNRECP
jgi:hypothetical protein